MRLDEFCTNGEVKKPVTLVGVSAHFVGGPPPTLEQWRDTRVKFVIDRRYTLLDDLLHHLFDFKFAAPVPLREGQLFEVESSDDSCAFRLEFEVS